ncbi:imidazole glycerol phosphate synthase subunit HisF, partial [Nonlabens mediterrranea]|nr:imidazole glycerol phosphate synthase subunit HisF [Nonlabens mediterrranea]
DITATIEKRDTLVPLVREIAAVLNIPFTVGGGINDVALAKEIIKAGADKIAINSAAVKRPELISELAAELGSQCVVVAVDTKHSHESGNLADSKNKPDESTPTDFHLLHRLYFR